MVAVSVTLALTTTEDADAASVTVLAVVPAGGSQKPLHPQIASSGAARAARRIRLLLPPPNAFDLILCTFPGAMNPTSP
jgi:hypothetical protein